MGSGLRKIWPPAVSGNLNPILFNKTKKSLLTRKLHGIQYMNIPVPTIRKTVDTAVTLIGVSKKTVKTPL